MLKIIIKGVILLKLIILSACTILPGINNLQTKKVAPNFFENNYSIDDIGIEIIKINSFTENDFNILNESNVEELNFNINKFENIYNYRYEYILGPADIISINLTDTDDLDNSYEIDPDGMIDLPFIGKIKISELTVDEAQNILRAVISDFYKNSDLQINVDEYNSSKVYIVGAVRNQLTINLDQKPIRIIEAAIQANFNPNAADKLLGTKGFLRRDNQVYKINLNNSFASLDDR